MAVGFGGGSLCTRRTDCARHEQYQCGSSDPAALSRHSVKREYCTEYISYRCPDELTHVDRHEEDDVIVLGDFNAGCDYVAPDVLDSLELAGPDYV